MVGTHMNVMFFDEHDPHSDPAPIARVPEMQHIPTEGQMVCLEGFVPNPAKMKRVTRVIFMTTPKPYVRIYVEDNSTAAARKR